MSIREYAESVGFKIIGKLRRMPDKFYGLQYSRCKWYMDDAGNEYYPGDIGTSLCCIVTADGRII